MRRLLIAMTAALLLVASGCGSDDSGDSGSGDSGGSSDVFPGVTVSGSFGEEPTVEVEAGFEADETATEVVEEGDGAELEEGDTALVHYIGINGRTGDEFNNSWGEGGGDPVPFPLTEGGLITGFLEGLVGQQVGSRVAIAIPPEDGYGPSGGNPDIDVKKTDSLLFVVDIEDTALSAAEGEPQPLPDDVPQLETNADDVPTGFTATAQTAPAPEQIRAEVAIVGTGPEVKEGQTISFKYLAQIYPDGKVLDDAYSRGQSAQAVMGSGQPACWDALIGQTIGSRVVLECPPGSVFGPEGSTELGVGPKDTLLFAMDLLTVS